MDIWELRDNFTTLLFQFLKFETEGALKDICILIVVSVMDGRVRVPIIFVVECGLWLVIVGFEMGGDGGVEMACSPALFFVGVGVVLVAGEDVAQHEGKKIYYKLTSAD